MVLVATVGLAASASAAPVVTDQMPSQAETDLASTDPGHTSSQAGWGDMADGVAARPYVRSLSVTNGDVTTDVITDGGPTAPTTSAGDVTAVVSPINLCRVDQSPSSGVCYATPNRVALTLGYDSGSGTRYDFTHPHVATTPAITADSVIDMTVALNTLGRTLRWSWVSGHLMYWRVTNLGQDDATVRVKFTPGWTPYVAPEDWPTGNGCTATPIFNCDLTQAAAEVLQASMLFSLDDTLDKALTGAVFATRNAMYGFLRPGQSPTVPTMDIQAASTHFRSDGSLQRGTLEALIPAAALQNVYGVLPADAPSLFAVRRYGSGTNDPPAYTAWTYAEHGSDGLLVTVDNISFSVPKYRISTSLKRTPTNARVKRGTATVTANVAYCKKKRACVATVYRLGRTRYSATRTPVISGKRFAGNKLELRTNRLARHDRYLLVVRSAKTGATVGSTLGKVN